MPNDPGKLSWRQDLKRWEDEGGAPRSGHRSHRLAPSSRLRTETTLYYFNIRTESGVIEDPEGGVYPDLQAAREEALATARGMIAEGDRVSRDRRNWRFEIMDRANQHVLTVMFSDAADSRAGR